MTEIKSWYGIMVRSAEAKNWKQFATAMEKLGNEIKLEDNRRILSGLALEGKLDGIIKIATDNSYVVGDKGPEVIIPAVYGTEEEHHTDVIIGGKVYDEYGKVTGEQG